MPIIKATYPDPDTADRSVARLRQAGIAFTASYQKAPSEQTPGGYLAHVAYPNSTSYVNSTFGAQSYQFQPAMFVATNTLPQPTYSRQTQVSVSVPRASLDRALAILRNTPAYSVTQ